MKSKEEIQEKISELFDSIESHRKSWALSTELKNEILEQINLLKWVIEEEQIEINYEY